MKQKLILMASVLLSSVLVSQSVPRALEDWKTTQGTQNFFYKNVTKTDAFGNVFVAGATMNAGFPDILVAKYNPSGSLLWIQQFAGTAPGGVDFAAGMYVTDSHVYLTGAVSNNSVVPETDCITMKLASSNGSVVWSSTYSGSAGGHDGGKNITVDGAGNVFVSGLSYNSSFNSDFLILSYNSSGVQQWASTWDYVGGDDASVKVAISGSNLNISGAVTTATSSVYKVATIQLAQSSGSLLATNVSTAVTTTTVDIVCDMATDNGTGDIVIVGSTNVGGQGTNIYVQKLSNTLVTNWAYSYNGSASLDDIAKAVDIDGSGNVFVSGYTTSATLGKELALIKLNSSGVHQWTQTSGFPGDDEALDLIVDANNDCYITGYKTATLSQNYYTVKYSSAGTKLWEIEADGNSAEDDNGTNLTLDSLNNVIVTGQSKTPTGDYEFLTIKYVQKDVIVPTDFNGEAPSQNFMYYRNAGQLKNTSGTAIPDVKFYTNHTSPSFYFQPNMHSFVFSKVDTIISTTDSLHRIDVSFNNSKESGIYPMESQEVNYLNYYLPSGPVTNVKGNQRLLKSDLYNNIDLMYSSNQNGIKYYFIVKPGGDLRDIDMEFTGASSFNLDGTTNELTISSPLGSITFDRPTAYQLTAGNAIVAVTGWTPDWQTNGASNKYTFNSGAYTSSLTLIIQVDQGNSNSTATAINNLCWSTYFGGDGYDAVYGVAKDGLGNQYMAGGTMSTDLPPSSGPFQGTLLGEIGAFFVKFGTLNQRLFNTYYAGCGADKKTTFWDVKCKSNNSEIVVGGYTTCGSLFLQSNSPAFFDNSLSGPEDAFVGSFNDNGLLLWSTLLGGTGSDRIQALDFDSNGNLYVVGIGGSGFPLMTTPSYNQSVSGTGDGFITKFDNNRSMVWSTMFGGNDADGIYALKIDNANRLMMVGNTLSSNLPCLATGSAYADNTLGGTSDNFISVFSANAQQLWTAYIGGSTPEACPVEGMNNICSNANSIFMVGTTQSSNFPVLNPGGGAFYDNSLSVNAFPQYATGDGFVMEFDKTTFQHKWGTLVSGNGASVFRSAEVDANGNLFVSGCTGDNTIPFTGASGAYVSNTSPGGGLASNPSSYDNGVILSFSTANRKLNWCTLFGGYNDHPYGDDIYDMVLIGSDLYIGGMTTDKHIAATTVIPLVDQGNGNYFKNTYGGSFQDAIISKFCTATIVGVEDKNDKNNINEVSIYPNPAENVIYIDGKNLTGEVNVAIYNASGQVVLNSAYTTNGSEITQKIANLANGFYIVKINDRQNTFISKFIKQ